MCVAFSPWHHVNYARMSPSGVTARTEYVVRHLESAIEMHKIQLKNAQCCLHERPGEATSWQHRGMQKLKQREDVFRVTARMCMYGVVQTVSEGETSVLTPTEFMMNCWGIAKHASKRVGGTAAA